MQNNQETTKIFNEKSKGDKNGDNYILKEDFTNNESFISSNVNLNFFFITPICQKKYLFLKIFKVESMQKGVIYFKFRIKSKI